MAMVPVTPPPSVWNCHACFTVGQSTAWTMPSLSPMATMPSATAGEREAPAPSSACQIASPLAAIEGGERAVLTAGVDDAIEHRGTSQTTDFLGTATARTIRGVKRVEVAIPIAGVDHAFDHSRVGGKALSLLNVPTFFAGGGIKGVEGVAVAANVDHAVDDGRGGGDATSGLEAPQLDWAPRRAFDRHGAGACCVASEHRPVGGGGRRRGCRLLRERHALGTARRRGRSQARRNDHDLVTTLASRLLSMPSLRKRLGPSGLQAALRFPMRRGSGKKSSPRWWTTKCPSSRSKMVAPIIPLAPANWPFSLFDLPDHRTSWSVGTCGGPR